MKITIGPESCTPSTWARSPNSKLVRSELGESLASSVMVGKRTHKGKIEARSSTLHVALDQCNEPFTTLIGIVECLIPLVHQKEEWFGSPNPREGIS